MPSSRATVAEGWLLLLSIVLTCQHACNAGPAAGAAASTRQREQPSRGWVIQKGNSNRRCCGVEDQAAGSRLPELRGGRSGVPPAGGNISTTSRGVEGGDAADPIAIRGNHDLPVTAAATASDSTGSNAHATANVNANAARSNEEEREGEVVEEREERATWLDGDGSGGPPITPPASELVVRGCFLILVFLLPMLSAGLAFLSSWFREKVWYGMLTRSIGLSGTAFIKWGQWSSTRPDMFPEGLCEALSVLHKGAPSHRFAYTKRLVERAFGGRPISEVFEWFESKPMASGSIAQVHKAVLDGKVVAVKVRHPKVKERMSLDFALMKKIAAFADRRPSLKWMNLGPSMEQFSNTMSAQTDLVLEAKHLDLFNANFGGPTWSDCSFPRVVHCVEDVLVETFEEGVVVAEYAKLFGKKPLDGEPGMWEWGCSKLLGGRRRPQQQGPEREKQEDPSLGHFIVTRGSDMWLKMVLSDGLLHADLHPGNILVYAPEDGVSPPRLVLVDAGMVAKLYGHQQRHFIRLLECLGSGDGVAAGLAVLQFSTKQTCVGYEERGAFLADMDAVFKDRCKGYNTGVDVGNILRGILTCVRRHSVRVDVEYATLILNILCLDSMGKVLLPTYNLLDGSQTLLETHKFGRRLVGGFGVKKILPLARAVKWRQDRKFLRRLKRDAASEERKRRKAEQQAAALETANSAQGWPAGRGGDGTSARPAAVATATAAVTAAAAGAGARTDNGTEAPSTLPERTGSASSSSSRSSSTSGSLEGLREEHARVDYPARETPHGADADLDAAY
ncbi:unnamed protein product [Pylaiella littoralis]